MHQLSNEMNRLRSELNLAIELSKQRGTDLAQAEQAYRIALAKEILTQRANKIPVTIVNDIARGKEDIAKLKFQRDSLEVIYKSANEKINATKLEIRIVENQMEAIRRGV